MSMKATSPVEETTSFQPCMSFHTCWKDRSRGKHPAPMNPKLSSKWKKKFYPKNCFSVYPIHTSIFSSICLRYHMTKNPIMHSSCQTCKPLSKYKKNKIQKNKNKLFYTILIKKRTIHSFFIKLKNARSTRYFSVFLSFYIIHAAINTR